MNQRRLPDLRPSALSLFEQDWRITDEAITQHRETQYLETFREVFNPQYMERPIADMHCPIPLHDPRFLPIFTETALYGIRILHYLIKQPGNDMLYLDALNEVAPDKDVHEIREFIGLCWDFMLQSSFKDLTFDRYLYLTIDTADVPAGATQRTSGWHIDCVQGDEVPVKQPGNIAFSWCDTLPTEYAHQTFDMEGIDLSTHNIFDWCARQVNPENIKSIIPGAVTLMNTYCVHRCAVATEFTRRRYVRLSFTHVPITNKKLTINTDIRYDYPIHSTGGEIPAHLV